jgi:hypothetical protein
MTMMGCFSVAGRLSRSAAGATAAGPAAATIGEAALPPLTNKPPFSGPAGAKHSDQSVKDAPNQARIGLKIFKQVGVILTGRRRAASEGCGGGCRRRTHPGHGDGRGRGGGEVGEGHSVDGGGAGMRAGTRGFAGTYLMQAVPCAQVYKMSTDRPS